MATERVLLVVLAALFGTGCIGARTSVIADTSQYPISLSGAVRDADGNIAKGEALEPAGKLHAESTAWGLLYSGVSLTPTTDVSKAVNQEVKRTGGDAVVNLRISSTQCPLDFMPIVHIVPIWPGCAQLVIEGDIVRVKRPIVHTTKSSTPSRIASASVEAQRL